SKIVTQRTLEIAQQIGIAEEEVQQQEQSLILRGTE
ncbi:unnamed protein product, partial [marine sediment metagenome]